MRLAGLTILCAFAAGCGSGSTGGSATEGNAMVPQPVPGVARVLIATHGPTPDTVLYAAQLTLRFPAGVSLPGSATGGMAPAEVFEPAPAGSFGGAGYLEPAPGLGPALQIGISHPQGFTVGPLATVNCALDPGARVTAGDIAVQGFSARDLNGAPIPGITTRLTLETK